MHTPPHLIRLVIVLLLSFSSYGLGFAATSTTTFSVTANVVNSCTSFSASTLAFGNYTFSSSSPTDSSTTISVTCSNGTSYALSLDAGTTSGATLAQRLLSDGSSHSLQYNLYTSSGRTTVWGDGSGSTSTVSSTGSGSAALHTVYGRIPALQNTAYAGSYSDTITVTVTY